MIFVGLKVTMSSGTAGMHDALWNAFMVKVRDFFTHDEVFQQRWAAGTDFQGVLVIRNLYALVSAQGLIGGIGAKLLKAFQLGIGVAAVQGVGPGQRACWGGRFFRTHQS